MAQEGNNITSMTDYCGNLRRSRNPEHSEGTLDSTLAFILMPEGRFVPLDKGVSGDLFQFEYFIKDHLGNTRSIVSHSGKVLEEDSYYPFGMNITTLSKSTAEPGNRYLYNGKELSSDFGLEWYEYGFRMYDAQIARFPSLDPKADEFAFVSPYNYAENRPIDCIDLWGLQRIWSMTEQQQNNAEKKIAYYNNSFQRAMNKPNLLQGTISQGETNYARMFNSTVTPAFQTQYATNPVFKSVAAGVVAAPFAENYSKALLINLTVNTATDLASGNYMTPLQEIEKTFNGTDMADPIISSIPGASSLKTAVAVTTSLIDITPENGIETVGNKAIENILFDGLTNKMNDNVEKVIPNSNWSKPVESFSTPLLNFGINRLKQLKLNK